MKKEWVLKIMKQCAAAQVPFFFKQWGGVRKREGGRQLEGKTYDEIPDRTKRVPPPRQLRLEFIETFERSVFREQLS